MIDSKDTQDYGTVPNSMRYELKQHIVSIGLSHTSITYVYQSIIMVITHSVFTPSWLRRAARGHRHRGVIAARYPVRTQNKQINIFGLAFGAWAFAIFITAPSALLSGASSSVICDDRTSTIGGMQTDQVLLAVMPTQ